MWLWSFWLRKFLVTGKARSQKAILKQNGPLIGAPEWNINFCIIMVIIIAQVRRVSVTYICRTLLKQLLQTNGKNIKDSEKLRRKETKNERERRHAILYGLPAIYPEQVNDSNVLSS